MRTLCHRAIGNREIAHLALAGMLVAAAAGSRAAGEPAAPDPGAKALEWVEPWSSVFGARAVTFHVRVVPAQATRAKLLWRFAAGAATLARGGQTLQADPPDPATVAVRLSIPAAKPGPIVSCSVTASLVDAASNREIATATHPIHVFPESPFEGRTEWLKSLDIRLFDPEQRTRGVFEKVGIPFKTIANPDTISNLNEGLLIVGEGVSLRDYRALAILLRNAAERGRAALVLAPGGGDFSLPEPRRLLLASEDVIAKFDKRLDAVAWPPDGKLRASAARLVGERGPVKVECGGMEGWPWIEMTYIGGGRLVICGWAIIEKWEATPTPRFLLAEVLEHMTSTSN